MSRPRVICLTPVKNEAWILERFLRCATSWADHIIVADQGSEDGSRSIARRFSKVRLIENGAREFNELARQKLLIEAARQIPGPKLLIALDADEFLTGNFRTSSEWELMMRAVPGTIIRFQLPNILPDRASYYLYPTEFTFGFMDDGTPHDGPEIHSPRLPQPEAHARISLREIKVMHFATMDAPRFRSRIRWYQCWEFLHERHICNGRWDGNLIQLYRDYHRDYFVAKHLARPVPAEWVAAYGDDLLDAPSQSYYRWDEDILRLLIEHGPRTFRKVAIWDVDWDQMYRRIHGGRPPVSLVDPRSRLERWVHRWCERTQPAYSHGAPPMRIADQVTHRALGKCLALAGWQTRMAKRGHAASLAGSAPTVPTLG
jgi:glycosyltransferase involved in cell wall biosynthesis